MKKLLILLSTNLCVSANKTSQKRGIKQSEKIEKKQNKKIEKKGALDRALTNMAFISPFPIAFMNKETNKLINELKKSGKNKRCKKHMLIKVLSVVAGVSFLLIACCWECLQLCGGSAVVRQDWMMHSSGWTDTKLREAEDAAVKEELKLNKGFFGLCNVWRSNSKGVYKARQKFREQEKQKYNKEKQNEINRCISDLYKKCLNTQDPKYSDLAKQVKAGFTNIINSPKTQARVKEIVDKKGSKNPTQLLHDQIDAERKVFKDTYNALLNMDIDSLRQELGLAQA